MSPVPAAESLPPAARAENTAQALHRSGVPGAGHVRSVEVVSSFLKLRSHTLRLRVHYEEPPGEKPPSVILKMGHLHSTGRSTYANRREIAFYRNIALALPKPPLVPFCFKAVEAKENSPWHLLLEDLTDSHFIATDGRCRQPGTNARASCARKRACMLRYGTVHC